MVASEELINKWGLIKMLKKTYNMIENVIDTGIGTEKAQLEGFYNTLDWLDVGLVVFIIFRFGSETLNPLLDIALGLASIVLCATAFVTSGMLRKRGWISKGRLIFRFFWWPLWIPIDLFFIGMALVGLVSN